MLTQVECHWSVVVEGIMFSGVISINFPSGDEETSSTNNETPSNKEGRWKDATASLMEGMEGSSEIVGIAGSVGNVGIEESWRILEDFIGSISLSSIYFSRLELTKEDYISASNLPSE